MFVPSIEGLSQIVCKGLNGFTILLTHKPDKHVIVIQGFGGGKFVINCF